MTKFQEILSFSFSQSYSECKHRIDALQKEVQAATAEVRRITMERQGLERTLKAHNV